MEKGDAKMLDLLRDMSILTDRDLEMLNTTFPEQDFEERDQFIASILLDTDAINHQELSQVKEFIAGLNSENLLTQTKTRINIAKFAVSKISQKIEKNIDLSNRILRSTERLKKKSSSEYLSLNAILELSKK